MCLLARRKVDWKFCSCAMFTFFLHLIFLPAFTVSAGSSLYICTHEIPSGDFPHTYWQWVVNTKWSFEGRKKAKIWISASCLFSNRRTTTNSITVALFLYDSLRKIEKPKGHRTTIYPRIENSIKKTGSWTSWVARFTIDIFRKQFVKIDISVDLSSRW